MKSNLFTYLFVLKIQRWMFEMNRTHRDLVDMFSVGKSYEGRPLYVLQVGQRAGGKKVYARAPPLKH